MAIAEQPDMTPKRIMEMAWGFAPPLILEAATRLKVFDVLDDGPKTIQETADATKASVRGLTALMDALVGLNLLARRGPRYGLTPESSAFLVSTKPAFQGGFFRHIGRQLIARWIGLTDAVQTGNPIVSVNQQNGGAEFFRDFVEDLFPMNYPAARALAADLEGPLSALAAGGPVNVLDIAAGSGLWGIALAERLPAARVTAVDWPVVAPVARKVAARHQVADRYRVIEGDLLEADFGGGYHVATLGHILHSEGDARSRQLIQKVFEALAPGGTIAIAEFVADEGRQGPPMPLIFSVNMLVATDRGRTFTFGEMTQWLRETGFQKARLLNAPAVSPLLLAEKAGF